MRTRRRVTILAAMAAAPWLGPAACADVGANELSIRDSAGVQIVENAAGAWDSPAGWKVSAAPRSTIGLPTENDPAPISTVNGAMRQSDGTIVVGDRGAYQVKYFSEDGRLLHATGRQGQGPGEFEYLAWLKPCGGDSAFTWDIGPRRMLILAPDGSVARSASLESPEDGPPFTTECSRSGTLVTSGWGGMPKGLGPYRPMAPLGIDDAEGQFIRKLGDFPGTEMLAIRGAAGPRRLGRWLMFAVSDSAVYVAPGDDADIRVFDLSGQLRRIIRQPDAEVEVTSADLEFMKAAVLDSAGTTAIRARRQRELANFDPPETLPPFADLLTDPEGNLWVKPYPRPDDMDTWRVFRPDGSAIGTVTMPPGLHVLEIGTDYLLGVVQDEAGVELIEVYGLTRGA